MRKQQRQSVKPERPAYAEHYVFTALFHEPCVDRSRIRNMLYDLISRPIDMGIGVNIHNSRKRRKYYAQSHSRFERTHSSEKQFKR